MYQIHGVLAILLISIITVIECQSIKLHFLNVVFRHGDRTPNDNGNESYPNDPNYQETFFPVGLGRLTNKGKLRQYNLGEALRKRYNAFLGNIYVPEDIMARSTDYERTKMSLSLVLAGLYPPSPVQKWHPKLNWQPIPTTYLPRDLDALMFPYFCSRYVEEIQRVTKLPQLIKRRDSFRPLMNNLTIATGKPINDVLGLYFLYQIFMSKSSMGFELPDWSNGIFPHGGLEDAAYLLYDLISYNDLLKKLNGGRLLNRFSNDMIAMVNGTTKEARKMNLFSGHDSNIVSLLAALGVYKPHVPQYTSAVIVELLGCGNNYFVKVLHYLGNPETFEELTIPGCAVLCPFEDFLKLLANVRPTNDELGCILNTIYSSRF